MRGIATYRDTGAVLVHTYWLGLLADAYGEAGRPAEGLHVVAEGLSRADRSGERFFEAELHRLRGTLLLKQVPPDEAGAEAAFLRALDVARHQCAVPWELRAAIALTRLYRERGQCNDAKSVMARVFGKLAEGDVSEDAAEARALLQELG
jgi:predicted ATPase